MIHPPTPQKRNKKNIFDIFSICLVYHLKLTFLHFKQYYTHLHIFFHPHVFQKTTNNISQTTLPNTPLVFMFCPPRPKPEILISSLEHHTHFFHPHVFQKTTNNISQTTLPNTLLVFMFCPPRPKPEILISSLVHYPTLAPNSSPPWPHPFPNQLKIFKILFFKIQTKSLPSNNNQ